MNRIKILIADDHPVYRFGLVTLLQTEPDLEIVAEAGSGDEAITLAKKHSPHIVLMDINMPGLNGIEATRAIRAACPETKVLVISMLDDDTVFSAIQAGASGYLQKGSEGDITVQAVHVVVEGGTIFSPGMAKRVLARFSDPQRHRASQLFPELTPREHDALKLIARGLSNPAIAERLAISPKTARNLVSSIYRKLQVSSRKEAAVKAKKAGLEGG